MLLTAVVTDAEGNSTSASATADTTSPPIPGATLAWSESFADLSAFNVQDMTTRSNEQSVALASNVSVANGELTIAVHKLTTPVKSMNYSSGYVDSIGKPARSVRPGQYLEFEARFGLRQGASSGLWPGLLWLRSQLGTVEIDIGEDWGTPGLRAGTSDDPSGRYLCTYWPNTNGSLPKVAGFMAAKGELDLTTWQRIGIRIDTDGSITPYRGGAPFAPTGGAWPAGKPTLTAAANPGLKPIASDYYNLRINVQVGNSYYGSPDAATDFTQTMGIRNLRCWNLAA